MNTPGKRKYPDEKGVLWLESGYGWLPYEYVLAGLADDFWCLIKQEWIDTDRFS